MKNFFKLCIYSFIYVFLAMPVSVAVCGLSLVVANGKLLFIAVLGLLIEVTSLVPECRL